MRHTSLHAFRHRPACSARHPRRASQPPPCGRTALHTSALPATIPARVAPTQTSEELLSVLHRIRTALRLDSVERVRGEVQAVGTGRHMGLDVVWELRFRPDGAFYEQIRSSKKSFSWGYSGGSSAKCWEVDSTGLPKELDYDDHETTVLAAWARTGSWLSPQVASRLSISWGKHGPPSSSAGPGPRRGQREVPGVTLKLQLNDGRASTTIRVCSEFWRPEGLAMRFGSDYEAWQFWSWRTWEDGIQYPGQVSHDTYAGANQRYITERVKLLPPVPTPDIDSVYSFPQPGLDLPFTQYDATVSRTVQGVRSTSGHLLVPVDINGAPAGYMMVDTGASICCIDSKLAEHLNLERFGETYVSAVSGKLKSGFHQARSLRVGPLTLLNPSLLAMDLSQVVRGGPQLAGILGYDVFRRAVIEIPARGPEAPYGSMSSTAAATTWPLHDPQQQQPQQRLHQQPQLRLAAEDEQPSATGLQTPHLMPSSAATVQETATDQHQARISSNSAASTSTSTGHGSSSVAHGSGNRSSDSSVHFAPPRRRGRPPGSGNKSKAAVVLGDNGAGVPGSPAQEGVPLQFSPLQLPSSFSDPRRIVWHPFCMICSLPHIQLRFSLGGREAEVLLMLDTGASGSDIMLHHRAVLQLGLLEPSGKHKRMSNIKGVGTGGVVSVVHEQLDWLELGGIRVHDNLVALLAKAGGLDISVYSSGIACGDLMSRFSVIYDYANKRVGLVMPDN